jgi:hypothetical protein
VRPLLLVDVDGPLNPYAAKPEKRPAGYVTHRMRPTGWDAPHIKPLRVWLNPDHGPALLKLPYDLVWCTTWQAEANVWIGPHLGLPDLPHVSFDDVVTRDIADGTYFKTHEVVRWAALPIGDAMAPSLTSTYTSLTVPRRSGLTLLAERCQWLRAD